MTWLSISLKRALSLSRTARRTEYLTNAYRVSRLSSQVSVIKGGKYLVCWECLKAPCSEQISSRLNHFSVLIAPHAAARWPAMAAAIAEHAITTNQFNKWMFKNDHWKRNAADQPDKRLTNRLMFIVLCSKVARWLVCLWDALYRSAVVPCGRGFSLFRV